MSEKIRISWDEVYSPQVDEKLRQQDAATRVMDHYRQRAAQPAPPRPTSQSIWYHAPFYMTVFGVIAGLLGWVGAEVFRKTYTIPQDAFRELIERVQVIELLVQKGIMSEADAEKELQNLLPEFRQRYPDNPFIQIATDPSLSPEEKRRRLEKTADQLYPKMVLSMALFSAVAAMLIGVVLSASEGIITRNWNEAFTTAMMGLFFAALGGAIGGAVAQIIYGKMGGGLDGFSAKQVFIRSFAWGIAALGMAVAPGIALKSAKKTWVGLAGGAIGGLLGGALFDPIGYVTGSGIVSRLVGFTAIGALAGLGTSIVENIVKSGWLKVTGGLLAGKQFVLYKDVTTIGSSPKCEIYLFKDSDVAPRHAEIVKTPRGYEIHDLNSATGTLVNGAPAQRKLLKKGDQIQIGATLFCFEEKSMSN